MINICALLLSDTYKQTHDRMYPSNLEYLTSYWVPRKSMLKQTNEMVFFGLQAFIKEYLIKYFNKNFFKKSWKDVKAEYSEIMNIQLGEGNYDIDKVKKLHNLGYLPLNIMALPEGTKVPMGIPCIEITNTVKGFAWLVQWIECILQVELWKPCNDATIGHMYHNLAAHYYSRSVDDNISPFNAFSNFDMRGDDGMEAACKTGAAWLLSSNKTSTIPTIAYLNKYYNADCANNGIGVGAISTEHSVMGANYALDGDERTFVKKLLTELYPNASFSMVSDTYDYWNMAENIIPSLKEEILAHNGKLLIRPDSGDMVEISIKTIESLWNTFGGSINSKGFRVLDPHVGLIYGDGCVIAKLDTIWSELEKRGFAANNIIFGVGAFCFKGIFEPGESGFVVSSRDTFGIAAKATWGKFGGKELFIYKDPKTDTAKLKKSHKGLVLVSKDADGKIYCQDQLYEEIHANLSKNSIMHRVFCDGHLINEEDFITIRNRVNDNSN